MTTLIPNADLLTDSIPAPPPADAIHQRWMLSINTHLLLQEDGQWQLQQIGTRWPIRLTREEAAQLHHALNGTFGL